VSALSVLSTPHTACLQVTYTFLQSLVLFQVVVRWLYYLSFQARSCACMGLAHAWRSAAQRLTCAVRASSQPRLSIIAGTLALALPDLLHFAVTVVTCGVMFAAAAVIVFGMGQEQLSSFSQAVYFMLRYVLLEADEGVFQASACCVRPLTNALAPQEHRTDLLLLHGTRSQALLSPSVAKSAPEWTLAGILYVTGPIFFVMILSNFILAFLLWPLTELKYGAMHMPGVPHDLACLLRWYWQRLRRGAPKNTRLLADLEVRGRAGSQRATRVRPPRPLTSDL
jgi:hypothetical protein